MYGLHTCLYMSAWCHEGVPLELELQRAAMWVLGFES